MKILISPSGFIHTSVQDVAAERGPTARFALWAEGIALLVGDQSVPPTTVQCSGGGFQ